MNKALLFVAVLFPVLLWGTAYRQPHSKINVLDAAIADEILTHYPDELCHATIFPKVKVLNNGDQEITNFRTVFKVNGIVTKTRFWTGILAPGASVIISFSQHPVSGTIWVSFAIIEVNGQAMDDDMTNNESQASYYAGIPNEVYGIGLSEDNEDYEGTYPTIAVVKEPIPIGGTGWGTFKSFRRDELTDTAGDPIGGYGQSDRSIFISFYQWDPEGGAGMFGTMTYQKLDFSNASNARLTFDRSHVRSWGSLDHLMVLVSDDCGDTWTLVYQKTSAQLITCPDQSAFYIPPANCWATDSVSLSAFDGAPEVTIQFKVISGWGNNLYLDNIAVSAITTGTSTQHNMLAGKVAVYPNPASTAVNIGFELTEATPVTIEILNMSGQLIATLDQERHYGAGNYIRTWNPENAGVYIARIRTETSEYTKRIVVVHESER